MDPETEQHLIAWLEYTQSPEDRANLYAKMRVRFERDPDYWIHTGWQELLERLSEKEK
jgi:hypothetical protein